MGDFISAEEIQTKSQIPVLNSMNADDIEFIYIDLAERAVEVALGLDLNTDRQPAAWAGRMDAEPRLQDEFIESYARAVFWIVERLAANPQRLKQQSVQGASAVYGAGLVDSTVRMIMDKWTGLSGTRRIGRA
jgi:hypothetical protein